MMGFSVFFKRPHSPHFPISISLSTLLYIAALSFSLPGLLMLIISCDGYGNNGRIRGTHHDDDWFMFPVNAMFISALTVALRCFFWVVGFFMEIRWSKDEKGEARKESGEEDGGEGEGPVRLIEDEDEDGYGGVVGQRIMLGDDDNDGRPGAIRLPSGDDGDDGNGGVKSRFKERLEFIKQILTSWNFYLAATLSASLGVLLWRLRVNDNGDGRVIMTEVVIGVGCLTASWYVFPPLAFLFPLYQ